MKIEQILIHYLIKNKKLTLQRIGVFNLDASLPDSSDSEKQIVIPENAVSFQYDPKAKEDSELVNYIVEHTNKIRSLASSDLDSFLSLGMQFLNIGKPFTLHNLGTLEKTSSGELIFKGGQLIAQKIEPQKLKIDEAEPAVEEENEFNDYLPGPKTRKSPKIFLSLLALLILAAIVWAVWHFLFNSKIENGGVTSTEKIIPLSDSSASNPDTSSVSKGISDSAASLKASADTFTFKVVVNQYFTPEAARIRMDKLKSYGRHVIMYTTDSVHYKVAEPFKLPLADTTKILDSLKVYYSRIWKIDK